MESNGATFAAILMALGLMVLVSLCSAVDFWARIVAEAKAPKLRVRERRALTPVRPQRDRFSLN